jgi:hypothetical protein
LFKDTEDIDDEEGDSASELRGVDQSGGKAKSSRTKKGIDKRGDKSKGKSSQQDMNQTMGKTSTGPAPTPSCDIENRDPKGAGKNETTAPRNQTNCFLLDASGIARMSTLKRPAESSRADFANKVPKSQANDHIAKVLGRLQQSGLGAKQVLGKTETTPRNGKQPTFYPFPNFHLIRPWCGQPQPHHLRSHPRARLTPQ